MSLADGKVDRGPYLKPLERRLAGDWERALWSRWGRIRPRAWHCSEVAGAVSSEISADFGDVGRALSYVVRKGICSIKNHSASRLIL